MSHESQKTALVTGVTGQDGAYICQLLLKKEYKVTAIYRRASTSSFWRLDSLGIRNHAKLSLVDCDLTDFSAVIRVVSDSKPREIYNLAAQSFVGSSFDNPLSTAYITGTSALHLLEAIRILDPSIRFYQASTSEMFGKVQQVPQSEATPFYPRSPYGVAKLFAHWSTVNYRESYGIFGTSGILFNHESPLRGKEFVTRKITDAISRVRLGQLDSFELGNLDARRDWGYAAEFVEGMWRMLQADEPDTFILSTGRVASVREFLALACNAAGIDIEFRGKNESEVCINSSNGKTIVSINPAFYRPAEVDLLMGDSSKAEQRLGWKASTSLESLCSMMINADLERNRTAK